MKKLLSSVMVGLATLVSFTACSPAGNIGTRGTGEPQAPAAPQPRIGIALRGEPPNLAYSALVNYTGALRYADRIVNANLDYMDEREIPQPQLAESLPQVNTDTWRVFPDGHMETTYHLKPNLTWQDGTPLQAKDFILGWKIQSDPSTGSILTKASQMEEVAAPDPRTVVIRWKKLWAEAGVLDRDFQPLPSHILDAPYRDLDTGAFAALPFWTSEYVGLGPYRVTRWEPGAFIEAEAFDGYVFGKPKIDKLKLLFIPDPNTALANLLSGEVHFISEFIFTATEGHTLEEQWASNPGGTVQWSPVNLRMSQFQFRPEYADPLAQLDVRVRQAIAYSIDSATAEDVLDYGKGVLSSTMTSPLAPFYKQIEAVITKYSYDPRKAAQLLEGAGYTKGSDGFYAGPDGKRLTIGVWSSSGPKNEQEAATFANGIKGVGIDASPQVFSAAQLNDPQARAAIPGLSIRGGAANYDWFIQSNIPGPDNRWQGNDRGGWHNPAYDQAYAAYVNTLDKAEVIRLIGEMERTFTADVGAIIHYFQPNVTAYVGGLKGVGGQAQTPNAGVGRLHIEQWTWQP